MTTIDLTQRLKGKIALVTAAGQGIGRAVAERLAAEGAEVHAADINPGTLATLKVASATVVDATDAEAVARWVAPFPRIDALVHAVGYVHHGNIETTTPEDWRRSMTITLDSAFIVLKHVIPRMKAHGGSVTTIASVAGSTKGFANRTAYGAAKGGVIGLTKACAADYLSFKIRCNAVCPGTVDSPSLQGRIAELAKTMGGDGCRAEDVPRPTAFGPPRPARGDRRHVRLSGLGRRDIHDGTGHQCGRRHHDLSPDGLHLSHSSEKC